MKMKKITSRVTSKTTLKEMKLKKITLTEMKLRKENSSLLQQKNNLNEPERSG